MKTKGELSAVKEEVENVGKKLRELSDDELNEVSGGFEQLIKVIVGLATQKVEVKITLPEKPKSE